MILTLIKNNGSSHFEQLYDTTISKYVCMHVDNVEALRLTVCSIFHILYHFNFLKTKSDFPMSLSYY